MRHDEPATMMHLIRPILLLLGVLVLLLVSEFASGDTVRIYDVAGSDGPNITLSQVAELDGEYANRYADLVVGRLPEGISEVQVETAAILEALRDQGARLGMLDLQGFGRCNVHRTFTAQQRADASESEPPVTNIESQTSGEGITVYTATTVRALIERHIAQRLGVDPVDLEVGFSDRDRELLNQSAVAGRYEIEPIAEPTLGAVSYRVHAYSGTQRVGNARVVSARVQQRVIALIAGNTISRDQPIHRRQVRLTEVLIDDPRQTYLTDPSLVTGLVASRTIQPGELITSEQIRMPIAVHRRQRVAVELAHGSVRITFNGIAQGEGAVGDTIEVENIQTGETIAATVLGPGRVEAGTGSVQTQGARR